MGKEDVTSFLRRLLDYSNLDVLNMDSKLLKLGYDVLSKCITDMINLRMSTGKFPSQFKIARVTSVFKNKCSPLDYGNYRPISCIPHVVKVMERVLHNSLRSIYLNTNLLQEISPLIILVTPQKLLYIG